MPAKKLVLAYVDSLRTDMLERAVDEGRAPAFGALIERGVLIPDCVSSFPSVTPVACAEMVTGVAADRHWISGMNWYHRLERRYVEYGSSLDATRAFGVFRALYDLVYNMNLAHLSPEIETLFEQLDDAGARTACTPFLIYRGRHRHQVSLDGLLRRAVDATRLKFRHHTWGPAELFYGDLYASREVPCRSTSIPGSRDGYSACCAAALAEEDLFDFLLLSLPDNDNYSHRHGPDASVESIAKANRCFEKLVEATGGLDAFLEQHALILLADHAQTPVHRGLPLVELLGREWAVLQPSEDRPERAQLAVSPTGRAAHVYLLEGEGERAEAEAVRRALTEIEGVELVCWLEGGGGEPVERREPGLPPREELWAALERGESTSAFAPAMRLRTCAAGAGTSRASSPSWRRRSRMDGCAARSSPIRWLASGPPSRRRTPATSSSRSLSATRRSIGVASRTFRAAATDPFTPATLSARCSSSAAAQPIPPRGSSGLYATWRQ